MKKILVLVISMAFVVMACATKPVNKAAESKELLSQAEIESIAIGESNARVIETELHSRKGVITYEVARFSGWEIDELTFDAFTGELLKRQGRAVTTKQTAILRQARLSHADALAVVSERMSQRYVIGSELAIEDGIPVYEIEFVDQYGLEHDAVVDAINGTLLALRQDEYIKDAPAIPIEQAEKTALEAVAGKILYTTLEKEHGQVWYEVDIFADNRIYEVNIDATSGEIIQRQ